jgi:formamidopyrimidine-DNA glycosylase
VVPEGLEVEIARRAVVAVVGRRIATIDADERCTPESLAPLAGRAVMGVGRRGKQLVIDTDGPTLGIHFGMTGRIVVDGRAPIERLEYGSDRDEPRWDRLAVSFDGGGRLRVNDPRRWARFTLDPDVSSLGPDLLEVTLDELRAVLRGRRTAVKAVLLDQHAVAGLGNMCVDEVLWHAGIAPSARADLLDAAATGALHRSMRRRLPAMLAAGGSHMGVLEPARRAALGPCPRDGAPLVRTVVGGRTTVSCSHHQVVGLPHSGST